MELKLCQSCLCSTGLTTHSLILGLRARGSKIVSVETLLRKEANPNISPTKVAAVQVDVRLHCRRLLAELDKDADRLFGRAPRCDLEDGHLEHLAILRALLTNLPRQVGVNLYHRPREMRPFAAGVGEM